MQFKHLLSASFAAVLLAFSLLPALACAASLSEEIGFHVDKSESYSVETVLVANQNFSLVKVGGVETMAFNPNNELVTDNASLDAIAASYALQLATQLRESTAFKSIPTDFNTVFSAWQLCEEASRPVREDWFQTYHIAAESGNDPQLKPAFDKLNNGTKQLKQAMPALKNAVDSLNASFSSPQELKQALENAFNQVQSVKLLVTPYAEGYAYLRTQYPDDFAIQEKNIYRFTCTLAASSFSALENDLSVRSQVPDAAAISAQLKNKTAQRKIKGEQNKKLAAFSNEYNALLPKIAEAREKYPLAQSIIDQRVNDLSAAYTKLNSTTPSNFNAYAADFESALQNARKTVEAFALAYADYNASKTSLEQLNAAIEKAEKRFGKNDERLNDLKKQALNLSAQFSAKEEELRLASSASPQDFKQITTAALNLTQAVSELQPPENTIDLVTIAVIAIVVLILAGFLVYLLKFRRRPPKISVTQSPSSPQFSSL
ncbi:MAG: hypothetical protein ACP5O3_00555 [Candidatus Micrarchaeia archaeon]|jgi:predicted  nucleic acid-binding Zn-ribbon protein